MIGFNGDNPLDWVLAFEEVRLRRLDMTMGGVNCIANGQIREDICTGWRYVVMGYARQGYWSLFNMHLGCAAVMTTEMVRKMPYINLAMEEKLKEHAEAQRFKEHKGKK